jgi:hypothetical protein
MGLASKFFNDRPYWILKTIHEFNNDHMKFPVIGLLKGDSLIYIIDNETNLKKASVDLVDTYKDSLIVDSSGKRFIVDRAFKTGWATIFWGYNPLINGRTATIDFEFSSIKDISLDEFKSILIERLKAKFVSHFYFDLSQVEMIGLVDKANSFERLMEIFQNGE